VALVIRGRPADLVKLTETARRLHLRASVALSGTATAYDVAQVRRSGLNPIPELQGRGVGSWFHASEQIEQQLTQYGLGRSFYYLAPADGFTLTDYLLVRRLGGEPVRGRELDLRDDHALLGLHPGEIIVANLASDRASRAALRASIRTIERSGLAIASVQGLAADDVQS